MPFGSGDEYNFTSLFIERPGFYPSVFYGFTALYFLSIKMRLKKTKSFFKKSLKVFIRYPILVSLTLIIFVILLVAGKAYFYFQKQPQLEIILNEEIVRVDFKTYQKVINEWIFRQQRFEKAPFKKYLDPFFEIEREIQEIQELTPLIEIEPQPLEPEKIKLLKQATTLFEFFLIKGDILPSIRERAKIWEEKGLGPAYEYQGFYGQNIKLLEKLKKGLE